MRSASSSGSCSTRSSLSVRAARAPRCAGHRAPRVARPRARDLLPLDGDGRLAADALREALCLRPLRLPRARGRPRHLHGAPWRVMTDGGWRMADGGWRMTDD
eukprot:6146899-Prymnesium_polylepis.1